MFVESFHIAFIKPVLGIVVAINIPSKVVRRIKQEQTTVNGKVNTNLELGVGCLFADFSSIDGTKL